MKVVAIQHDIAWADRDANFQHLEKLIRQAHHDGAEFIVLSEMFSTGFVVDQSDIGEPTGGPSSQFLSRLASELEIYICGSCPELDSDDVRPFNSLVLAHPNGSLDRYRKIHPFTYGGEDKHFRAGSEFLTVAVKGLRISFFVCYDLRFADEFWALAHTTDVYVIPANWPESRREHWMALLRARAIENQAYVIGCNRVGDGGGLHYSGDSMIIDPLGVVLAQGDNTEMLLLADLSADTVSATRERFPFLSDRR